MREPITVHDGFILDGGNRYRACLSAGVDPVFVELKGDSIASFVLSANLHRRHLTAGQRAAIVSSVQDWGKAQPATRPKAGNITGLSTVDDRMKESGASEKTQRMADKVAKASPELAAAVARGETSLTKAVEQISEKHEKQEPEEPEYTELDAAHDKIEMLQDMLAVHGSDDKKNAAEIVSGMRLQISSLTAELKTVKSSRDSLMRENGELKKQCLAQRKQIEKMKNA